MRLAFALLVAALAVPAPAAAQSQSRGQVTVTGEASVAMAPDTALIRVGVANDGKTAREASDANARLMTPVIAALKEAGIPERDIQTTYLGIHQVQEPQRPGPQRAAGFRASNQITAKVREIARVAEVIDRAVAAGANEVSGISFVVDDPVKALDRVRGDALAEARRKAEIYAKAAGAGLGRAVSIDEGGSARGSAPGGGFHMSAAPVMAGEQTLQVSVTVSYELLY